MKHLHTASIAFATAILMSTNSFAITNFKDEPIHTNSYPWSGFYAGLHTGIVQHTLNLTDIAATSFNASLSQVTNPKFTGGLQIGYRHQLSIAPTTGVYGVEFSADFSNARYDKTYGTPFSLYQFSAHNELKTLCLLEFIGGIATDKTYLFMTAGLSWANITGGVNNLQSAGFYTSYNLNKKVLGTTLGAGIEYGITEQISARLKVEVATPNAYTVTDSVGNPFRIANNIVQGTFAINYRFA